VRELGHLPVVILADGGPSALGERILDGDDMAKVL
jgi:hypothetical protein